MYTIPFTQFDLDQRAAPRYSVNVGVRLIMSQGHLYGVFAVNLSRTGILVAGYFGPPFQEPCLVSLDMQAILFDEWRSHPALMRFVRQQGDRVAFQFCND